MEHEHDGPRPAGASSVMERLDALAHNLRWSWHHPAARLFRDLDPGLWRETRHNPVALLARMEPARLDTAAGDPAFQKRVQALAAELDHYMHGADRWWTGGAGEGPIAYFSAEFGITECLPVYSGGLGVLAGDHLKSASDLGVPLVGVGLLYHEGYFRQHVDASGAQTESYVRLDFDALPIRPELDEAGEPARVAVPLPGRHLFARIWRAQVGRVRLLLLDTDIAANSAEDRRITAQLYGGDNEMRIQQEILLGIGGVRALRALKITPAAYHMNEGHSAFLGLEQILTLMHDEGLSMDRARETVAARTVFTTHTPVPAGHDRFSPKLMATYFTSYAREMGLSMDELMALGREEGATAQELFSMTVLALRLADHCNGVSRLHGQVSRAMLGGLWPDRATEDVPIGHVTNGIHLPSWLAPETQALLDGRVGAAWRRDGGSARDWSALEAVSDEELWHLRTALRERLVARVRDRLGNRAAALDPDALTVGFARRFATYKRATLLLRDEDRLERLVHGDGRPIQFLFAGKAHPRDEPGKAFIRRIVELSRDPRFQGRILFLENYDIALARALVQGADVWLNNPRRPKEASGTSGMKAAVNGALNVSVLDGWWDEAYRDAHARGLAIGWAIGEGKGLDEVGGAEALDAMDAEALYTVMEDEVVPTFYDRDENGRPAAWIARVRDAILTVGPAFNTHRMVRDYVEGYYRPATGGAVVHGD